MSEPEQSNSNNGSSAPELRAAEAMIAMAELRQLEANVLLARARFARETGITFDGARDEYVILGYDRQVTAKQYREEYLRGGIAGRIVEALPNATWRGALDLVEDDDPEKKTAFEQAWLDLDTQHQVQARLRQVDVLSRLSTYAVLLIGAPGALEAELPRGKPGSLLYLTPFLGGGGPGGDQMNRAIASDADAMVWEYDVDKSSPRFGLPKTYRLRRLDIASPTLQTPVHWTRILHVAENTLDDDVYGQPALERVWNLLADLRKVTGGGAEAFWLRANQGLHMNIAKDMQLSPGEFGTVMEKLKEESELYKHQMTRWLKTRGVDVQTLGSDVANFANPADAILTQIAGATTIPKRILTGSEMGELASSQDRENWRDQVNGRQVGYAGPRIVRPFVDRLIGYGYLPAPARKGQRSYEAKWQPMQVLTEDERATGAQKWASTNQTQGEPVFTDAEIRDHWYGFAPLTDEQRDEIKERKQEAVEMAQEAMRAQQPLLDPDAADEEEEEEELRAASFDPDQPRDDQGQWSDGSGGSTISSDKGATSTGQPTSGSKPKTKREAEKVLNKLLGGPKADPRIRKRANVDDLRRVGPSDLKKLIEAYEVIEKETGQKSFALVRAREELVKRERSAEHFELLRVLEAAIVAGNVEVVNRVIGLEPKMVGDA